MIDKLEIINRALGKVGLPRAAALNDCDWNAQEVFENIVQEILRQFPWNFAQEYASLQKEAAKPPHGFLYKYKLPENCLRVNDIRIHNDLRAPKARYEVVSGFVFCNVDPCYARYTRDEQDPANWSKDFCDVAATRIAAEIASLSGQKAELWAQLMQAYSLANASAQSADARESTSRVPLDNSIWAARQTNKG